MIARTWRDLSAHLAVQSRSWARQRQGNDKRAAELHSRRVYILPTRAGLLFAAIVFILLISSMNFSNNMGFALTFLLTGIGLVSMHHCQRNLTRLQLSLIDTDSCFAGERACFHLRITNPSRLARWQLQIAWDQQQGQQIQLDAEASKIVALPLKSTGRGHLPAPRIGISSAFPLGLFRAWAWVHMDATAIVWPKPARYAVLTSGNGDDDFSSHAQDHSGDDLSGVRDYRHGDSPRRIDWKALARCGELLVRKYNSGNVSKAWLDWDALEGHDTETRLALLARLALDAEAEGISWGLRLPCKSVPLNSGTPHLHACLNLLALHGIEPDQRRQDPH